jgi:hypothetical protein
MLLLVGISPLTPSPLSHVIVPKNAHALEKSSTAIVPVLVTPTSARWRAATAVAAATAATSLVRVRQRQQCSSLACRLFSQTTSLSTALSSLDSPLFVNRLFVNRGPSDASEGQLVHTQQAHDETGSEKESLRTAERAKLLEEDSAATNLKND